MWLCNSLSENPRFQFCLLIYILLFFGWCYYPTKKNKELTFLQNGQVDLENTITVLSLMFCSIKSLMGAILLGTSGEGVLARFRFETTIPMVEKQVIIATNNVYIWSHWQIYSKDVTLHLPEVAAGSNSALREVTWFFPFAWFRYLPKVNIIQLASLTALKQLIWKITFISLK